jgi:hypothetical protein
MLRTAVFREGRAKDVAGRQVVPTARDLCVSFALQRFLQFERRRKRGIEDNMCATVDSNT